MPDFFADRGEIELPFTGVGARSRLSKSCWDAFVVHSVFTLHCIDLGCELRQGQLVLLSAFSLTTRQRVYKYIVKLTDYVLFLTVPTY